MKLKQCLRMAVVCSVLTLAWSCQKTIPSAESDDADVSTIPRAAVPHPTTLFTGFGYDATGPYADRRGTRSMVIDVDRLRAATGTSIYRNSVYNHREAKNEFGAFAQEYSRKVSNKVTATAGLSLFGGNIGASYSSSNQGSQSYDGKYIYAERVLRIYKRHDNLDAAPEVLANFLTPQFQHDLYTRPASWIIASYGTHIVKNSFYGGRFYVLFRGENASMERESASRSSISVSSGLLFDLDVETTTTEDTRRYSETTNKELFYQATGGNSSISLGSGTVNLQHDIRRMSTAAWQSSVTYQNAELIDFAEDGLIPIWELISDPQKKQQIRFSALLYMAQNATKNRYNKVPVYSLYLDGWRHYRNQRWDNHVLSLNPGQEDRLMVNEGIAFYAYNYQRPGTSPVYRSRAERLQNNFFTMEPGSQSGYIPEGIAFYAYPNSTATNGYQLSPIYRYWSQLHTDHYYTTQNRHFINYTQERIEFYAPTAP